MLGGDRASFDEWQQIPLNAFCRSIRTIAVGVHDLVNLIDEYNTVLLRVLESLAFNRFGVYQPFSFGFFQERTSSPDLQPLGLSFRAPNTQTVSHLHNEITKLNPSLAIRAATLLARIDREINLNRSVVQRTFTKKAAEALASAGLRRIASENVKDTVLHCRLNLSLELFAHFIPLQSDGNFNEILDDGVNILAVEADFGVFCCFDFDERRATELGQSPCNFSLPDSGWPDHQNIFWDHFIAKGGLELHTAPPVPHCNCDSPLSLLLADDVLVEIINDLPWSHVIVEHRRLGFRGSRLNHNRHGLFLCARCANRESTNATRKITPMGLERNQRHLRRIRDRSAKAPLRLRGDQKRILLEM
mmetsp:Transcript_76483/g.205990  ORF Transcript_76483/g.205990 Transcript_76483/m.205990 type:complete len:360 (+) Transcript_76483:886-1965(+)